MKNDEVRFSNIVFFAGMEKLPNDIDLSLSEIRKWAFGKGYITDPEFQLLLDERINALSGCIGSEDNLQIALAIHSNEDEPFYFEYPYLPVKSLIHRNEEVEIYYWRMIPTRWDKSGKIIYYGEVKFGFAFPGCNEEFCSLSTAKLVVEKMQSLIVELSNEYGTEDFDDGSKEISVDGDVLATFTKEGRNYDISLSKKQN